VIMISILDIYDSLPDDEKEIIGPKTLYHIKENKKSVRASLFIPEVIRRYYIAQFGTGPTRAGEFMGFNCTACDRWLEYGHGDGCPVEALANQLDLDYKAIAQRIDKIRAGEESDADE